ncbi:uncharacterized protein LOC129748856 [Uranotaenia lowii]|uniref:uncharacterized protein LOC129748856 n=1 Tax=Uranotaenia lowii TaxID=190385 RepID=UPI0024795176|nr:uncharacterized protein LOC129748856 [Uranotaenia lowii]
MIKSHHCTLRYTDTTHLPPILPGSSKWFKFKRYIRTLMLVSREHPDTKYYLKSVAQISNENKRQVSSYPPFVVHPFSEFRLYWHMVIFVALTTHLFILAFDFSFLIFMTPHSYAGAMRFDLLLCVILATEIALKFVTGYVVKDTSEIVLDPRRIAFNYLGFRFLYDLIQVVPYILLLNYFDREFYTYSVYGYLTFMVFLYVISIARFQEIFHYFAIIPKSLRMNETMLLILKMVISTVYVLHWTSCLRFIIPELSYVAEPDIDVFSMTPPDFTNFSVSQFLIDIYWRHYRFEDANNYPVESRMTLDPPSYEVYASYYIATRAMDQRANDNNYFFSRIDFVRKNALLSDRYLASMMATVQISFAATTDDVADMKPIMNIMTSYLLIAGWFWFTYILIHMVKTIVSTERSKTKYEELINEFNAYAYNKRLSKGLQNKMIRHLGYRFRNHYFNQSIILRLMSDNLRRKVHLEICQHLIHRVEIFKGLPPTLEEDIADQLIYEIFLAGDVLAEAGCTSDSLIFLATGTAAVYTSTGIEIGHHIDGANFGAVSLLIPGRERTATVIALENCEVYRLTCSDFQRLIEPYAHMLMPMHRFAEERIAQEERNKGRVPEEDMYDNFLA